MMLICKHFLLGLLRLVPEDLVRSGNADVKTLGDIAGLIALSYLWNGVLMLTWKHMEMMLGLLR